MLSYIALKQNKHDVSRQSIRFTGVQNLQTAPTMCPGFAWFVVVCGEIVVVTVVARGKTKSSQWSVKKLSRMVFSVFLQEMLTVDKTTKVSVV